MIKANEARAMVRKYNENKYNEMVAHAERICDAIDKQIEEAANAGNTVLKVNTDNDLNEYELRQKVLTIIRENGFYADYSLHNKEITIMW